MLDKDLFLCGHIDVALDGHVDDFDCLIPEHYFFHSLGLKGEVTDSNGSDYTVISLDADDKFVIDFTVYENEFESLDGTTTAFSELEVRCTGTIIQQPNGFGDMHDILEIKTYDVVRAI